MIYTSHSPKVTQKIASQVVKKYINAKYQYIFVYITGKLGAGKTEFVKGIAKSLGFNDKKVKSPSFVFIGEFENKKYKLFHLDFYRINEKFVDRIAHDLLEENIGRNKTQKMVVCFEWAEKMSKRIKNLICNIQKTKCIKVKIVITNSYERKIIIE